MRLRQLRVQLRSFTAVEVQLRCEVVCVALCSVLHFSSEACLRPHVWSFHNVSVRRLVCLRGVKANVSVV